MTRVRKNTPGRILFVGSGPGDPALLTVRARDVLTGAAMAFTDPDVDKGVVALVGIDMGRDEETGELIADVRPALGELPRLQRHWCTRPRTATTSCVWSPATR